jgi:hypothetical protein
MLSELVENPCAWQYGINIRFNMRIDQPQAAVFRLILPYLGLMTLFNTLQKEPLPPCENH